MAERLKDTLYLPQHVEAMARALAAAWPGFDASAFHGRVLDDAWEGRGLTERTGHVTTVLRELLPGDYRAALAVLRRAEPALADVGWPLMSFSEFVSRYGASHWNESLAALEQFTRHMSAEFAVRPFLEADPPRMLAQMLAWAHDPDENVRRLASEGTRPRLPWAPQLPAFREDPRPLLPILEQLRDDPAPTVRRSVANNLNDIGKDHPGLLLEVAGRWLDEAPERRPLVAHALRSLVRQGDPAALGVLGYDGGGLAVTGLSVDPARVPIGGRLTFRFDLTNTAAARREVLVDYAVHHRRANGRLSPKVFRAARRSLGPGETVSIERTHSFEPRTTRRYHPGEHLLGIQVNGAVLARTPFEVGEAG